MPEQNTEPRCPDCGHLISDHENGRCLHVNTGHGYYTDLFCECRETPRAA